MMDDEYSEAELILQLQRDMAEGDSWEEDEDGSCSYSVDAPWSPEPRVDGMESGADASGGEGDDLQSLLTQLASYTALKVQQCEDSITSFDTSEADSAAAASAKDDLFLKGRHHFAARKPTRGGATYAAVVITDLEEHEERGGGGVRSLVSECDSLLRRDAPTDVDAAVADLLDSMVHSVAVNAQHFACLKRSDRLLSSALGHLVQMRGPEPADEEAGQEISAEEPAPPWKTTPAAGRELEQEQARARRMQSQLEEVAQLARQAEEEERERVRGEEALRALRRQRQDELALHARRERFAVRIQTAARGYLCAQRYQLLLTGSRPPPRAAGQRRRRRPSSRGRRDYGPRREGGPGKRSG